MEGESVWDESVSVRAFGFWPLMAEVSLALWERKLDLGLPKVEMQTLKNHKYEYGSSTSWWWVEKENWSSGRG